LPVVFVTGASGELVPEDLLARPYVRFVRKPWTRRELVSSLQETRAAAPQAHCTA
jgi:CheY-like chemotaxis protein